MASSIIKEQTVHQKNISVAGIGLLGGAGTWHYGNSNIAAQLPTGSKIISVNWGSNWNEDIIVGGHDTILYFQSTNQQTIGEGKYVIVSYIIE